MLTIQVLGPGCSKCNFLEDRAQLALKEIEAEYPDVSGVIKKVSDIDVFLEYGLLTAPGLVINGKLVCSGRVASQETIASWMREALDESL